MDRPLRTSGFSSEALEVKIEPEVAVRKETERLVTVPVSQLGLHTVAAGSNVNVDIVAVHGLGAIPEISWKDSRSGVTWISHEAMLPKMIPDARILRFGYDSLWLGKEAIRTRLDTIARSLLLELSRERIVSLGTR
jgi:hypothetical protein